MSLYTNELYLKDIGLIADTTIPWEKFQGKSVLLSGATGLLGSFLADVLFQKNTEGLDCTVYALGRTQKKAEERFSKWWGDKHLVFLPYDVNQSFVREDIGTVDYVLHLASNTHPVQYATDPIGTITTNITGLQNMLDFAVEHHATRFVFASSNEVYGENRGDTEMFDENYCGYIDSNTMRAGYPESKRCGEALCQAYKAQKNIEIVMYLQLLMEYTGRALCFLSHRIFHNTVYLRSFLCCFQTMGMLMQSVLPSWELDVY